MQFLRGLNDQFSNVRSSVLMMDPLPGIAKVFSYAVQQERQINSNDMIGNSSLINAASTSSSNSGLSCTYCGKDNHTVDKCFKKNGFPQNMIPKEEKVTRVALAEEIPVGKEASFVHIMVSLTTQLMNVTRSMVILLDINTISLKAQI